MPLRGVRCVRGYVGLEEHQRCQREELGPPCGIEPSILELITRPNLEREESGVIYSPSSISSCHRREVLSRDHDWYIDVKQGYKMVRGTIVHQGMGEEPPYPGVLGVVRELRMGAPINTRYGEKVFHGKPDLVVLLGVVGKPIPLDGSTFRMHHTLHVKLVDYKTKSEVGHDLVAPERDHVYQVNEYAWLVQQFLPGYLNAREEMAPSPRESEETVLGPHIILNRGVRLPHIDEIVVDELSIVYMDMVKPRTFTSKGFLYDQGKQLGDRVNGRWVRRHPIEYEELELEPIHQFRSKYTESLIRNGIEEQIEAETMLAPPLTGDVTRVVCRSCPVRRVCYDLGKREGYSMADQEPYIARED